MTNKRYVIISAIIMLTGAAVFVVNAAGLVIFGGDYGRGTSDSLVLDIKLSQANYNSGTKVFADSSGLGNNGTSANAATFMADSYGNNNRAMNFNGTTDTVVRSSLVLGNSATFESWGYATSLTGPHMLWNHQANSGINYYDLYFNSGLILLNTGDSNGNPFKDSNNVNVPSSIITLNKWYHYVVVVDAVANKAILYIDGEEVGTAVYKNPTSTTARVLYIGGPVSYRWQGAISNLKIYNRALSALEVRNLYKPRVAASSLQSGLVGYWPLDGDNYNSSTGRITDKTPYENSITNNGATLTTDRMGQSNGAMSFNGSSSYIYRSTLNNPASSQMTWSAWVKTSSSAATQVVIQQSRSSTLVTGEYLYQIETNGRQNFWDWNNGFGYSQAGTSNTVLNDGAWHQIAFVKDGVNGTFYLDGQADGTKTAAQNNICGLTEFVIGKDYRDGDKFFNGSISDVRIYNRALSASEISAIYGTYRPKIVADSLQQGLVFDMPLTSNWVKTETAGSQIMTDRTPYGHDGQNLGATISSDGATFNGSNYITFSNPINQANLNQEWSVSAWVNVNDADNQVLIYNLNMGVHLNFSTTKKLLLQLNWGANDYYVYSNATGLVANQGWKHVVFVFRNSDGLRKIYIDAVDKTGTGPNVTYTPSGISAQLRIGNGVVGSISNVKIYNRVLSAAEVKSLFDKGRF